MAKDSDKRRRDFDVEETGGGALSGLLAEEDEFDRRTLWRLGTWAAVSVAAVVVALVTNQSAIGFRREQTASADLIKQAQQLQQTARESQSETHRLASVVDTLNGDRDRLYSRVSVLEQGLDSVTGAIARQPPASSSAQANAGPSNSAQSASGQAGASTSPPVSPSASSPASGPSPSPSPAPATVASTTPAASAPTATASVDPPPAPAKSSSPTPVATPPVVAPVAAAAPAIADKAVSDKPIPDKPVPDKQAKQVALASIPSEPSAPSKTAAAQQDATAQPAGSLMAARSMIGPPDPAAGKPSEPATPPKTVTSAPLPEIAAVAPKEKPEEADPDAAPELVARHTEFGVDVGGANSVSGLRALWRALLKSRSNAALTTLRPIIVIKESNTGLGMQLRLVAGPIYDAAAAARICASLTISDRGCGTTVFEGQRLTMSADEQPKLETRTSSEAKPVSEGKPVSDAKAESDARAGSKYSGHRRYISRRSTPKEEEPPKPEPSTLSRIFGRS
jgi:hypothetical protein